MPKYSIQILYEISINKELDLKISHILLKYLPFYNCLLGFFGENYFNVFGV